MPTRSSSASASSRYICVAAPQRSRVRPLRLISALCTFSTTVIDTNVCATWNVRPTPRRQMRLAGAVRADDGQQPAGLEIEADTSRGHHTAERLGQLLDHQQAHAAALLR